MKKDIVIFTDGASKGNPGHGGWGAVIATADFIKELGGGEKMTTNNRMELLAAIGALSNIEESAANIKVFSDSSYVVNGITKWVHGWQKNDWISSQKKPVLNQDLWKKLISLSDRKNIEWQQVAGHADTPGNARADEIASAVAEGVNPELYAGPRKKYSINVDAIGESGKGGGTKAFYMSLVGGVVGRHDSWALCEKAVRGKSGVRFKKVKSESEARSLMKEWGISSGN